MTWQMRVVVARRCFRALVGWLRVRSLQNASRGAQAVSRTDSYIFADLQDMDVPLLKHPRLRSDSPTHNLSTASVPTIEKSSIKGLWRCYRFLPRPVKTCFAQKGGPVLSTAELYRQVIQICHIIAISFPAESSLLLSR